MSTAAALIAAIEQSGEDRLPWLVFSDWIEDRGFTEDAERLRECRWHSVDPTCLLSPDARCAVIAGGGEYREEELRFNTDDGPLTDRGLMALATTYAPQLRVLDVSYSDVTEAGVLAVVRAGGLPALRVLLLYGVRLSNNTVTELYRSPVSFVRGPDRDSDECDCRACRRWDQRGLDEDDWRLQPDRPDRHARLGHPGWSRHRWWGGYQVSQLCKRRRLAR